MNYAHKVHAEMKQINSCFKMHSATVFLGKKIHSNSPPQPLPLSHL